MEIGPVIERLNRRYGCQIQTEYYNTIQVWRNWWMGCYEPFHKFKERNGDRMIERQLYTLGMAKKVCEDWASILLNEKTQIVVDDEASSSFLQGKDGTGGVLGANDFWHLGNALIERVFYSGTGAFVLRLDKMAVDDQGGVLSGQGIHISYLDATQIVPLSVRAGKITEAAFVSEVLDKGETYVYLETHTLEDGMYVIRNEYLKEKKGVLTPEPLPLGLSPELHTQSGTPWFAILTPNLVNNKPGAGGLGLSIYANALDNLQGVDLAFNNLCRDFKLGGKKVFYNKALVQMDEHGHRLTPDDVAQQLFMQLGGELGEFEGKDMVHEFNPALRVQENKDGIQAQLDYLSFKCGLGTKHYQFNAGSVVTATQYMGDKQELVQNASKHYIVVERALKALARAILTIGRDFCGQAVNPDAPVTVNFEDSYIIDKESERQRDLQEVRDGILQKWEYRVKWYGEDEAAAKALISQERTDSQWMGFGE